MLRLFPFLLLVLLAAPVAADSVYQDGAATGRLVGAFDNQLNGHFVQIEVADDGLSIQAPAGPLALTKTVGAPTINGPLADFGDVQVHDNLHGWVHIQGDAVIQATDVSPLARGLVVDNWFLVATDLQWTHANGALTINATDTLLSNDPTFQNLGPEPSAWAILQGDDGNAVMDWFAFGDAPFGTESISHEVGINLVGTIGDGAPDSLIRIETDGHFAAVHDRFVFRLNTLAAASVDAEAMLAARGGFNFHARDVGHSLVDLRLPAGMSGFMRWQQDLQTPALSAVDVRNITPYAPLVKVPELVSQWDEPVWGELRIGEQQKVATQPASEVRFRLTGLQPETTYTYTLHGRDLAGNTFEQAGQLTTGPRSGPGARIDIMDVQRVATGHEVHFTAIADNGQAIDPPFVNVFVDKRAWGGVISEGLDGYRLVVPADSREVRIEVATATGLVSEVVALDDAQGAPFGWLLLPSVLALMAWHRRR